MAKLGLGISLGEFTHDKSLSYFFDQPRYVPALRRYSEELALVGPLPTSEVVYPKYSSIWCNVTADPDLPAPHGSGFPNPLMLDSLRAKGVTPVIFFESAGFDRPEYANSKWAPGSEHVEYLFDWGQSAGKWGRRFYLRINQEMNGNWAPWSPGFYDNTPENYISAWRYIVGIIEQGMIDAGGDPHKMKTIWAPQHRPRRYIREIWDFYPGNAWVDILGFDAYESKHVKTGTIERRFTPTYEELLTVPGRDIIVTETGVCASNGPDFCAKWYRDGLAWLSTLERFKGFMAFNIDMSKPFHKDHDWRMSPESQREFAAYL